MNRPAGHWVGGAGRRSRAGAGRFPVPQASIEFEVTDAEAVSAAGAELQRAGFDPVHQARSEPWGQTVAGLLTADGLIVGTSHAPSLHGLPDDQQL